MRDNPIRPTETGSLSQPSQCGARTRSGAPCLAGVPNARGTATTSTGGTPKRFRRLAPLVARGSFTVLGKAT
jgi:hypothetical protein